MRDAFQVIMLDVGPGEDMAKARAIAPVANRFVAFNGDDSGIRIGQGWKNEHPSEADRTGRIIPTTSSSSTCPDKPIAPESR